MFFQHNREESYNSSYDPNKKQDPNNIPLPFIRIPPRFYGIFGSRNYEKHKNNVMDGLSVYKINSKAEYNPESITEYRSSSGHHSMFKEYHNLGSFNQKENGTWAAHKRQDEGPFWYSITLEKEGYIKGVEYMGRKSQAHQQKLNNFEVKVDGKTSL